MGRGDVAAVRPGGGAVVQALRPARARLIAGFGALAALGAAVLYSVLAAGDLVVLSLALGIVALVVLALGIVLRWPSTIAWAVLFEAGGYLGARAGHDVVDGWAAVIGVLLLLAAELATWSIEHDVRIRTEPTVVARRALTLAALVGGALLVNFLVLGTAAVSASAGILIAAVGVAAAVTSVALVLRQLRT